MSWLLPARGFAEPLDLSGVAASPQPTVTFSIPEPIPRGHGTFHFGLASDFALQQLDRHVDCADDTRADRACSDERNPAPGRVPWASRSALLFELSLFDALSIGLRVPVVLTRADGTGAPAQTYGGIGDLGVVLSGAIASHRETRFGWQLAGSLPTATTGTLAGEPYVTLTPGLLLSQGFGRVRLAALLAYHIRKRYVVFGVERDDEIVAKLGARYMWPVGIGVLAELNTLIGLAAHSPRRDETNAEVDLGVRLGDERRVALDVGAGSAVWPGQYGLGAPQLRVFLALRGALGPAPAQCTTGPEDLDGYEDGDDCADLDNDRDGIPDSADACPNAAEDRDGFQDHDGCPDLDNDGDGVSDARDLCPDSAEDPDDFQDSDGCPEPDNDEDGVADAVDRCPLDPEDHDDFEDHDGCPEPGPAQPTVTRSGSHLLISDRVYFEDQSDTVRAVSTALLDTVANAFKALPGKPRLRVEGHSDDSGSAQHNVDLSYRRARAVVEYLKRRGIAAERLEYVGLGSAQPLGPHTSPEGRALNRRVEFVLIGQ